MYSLLSYLGLTSEKSQTETEIPNTSAAQRNTAIVLGSLAEKLAGKEFLPSLRRQKKLIMLCLTNKCRKTQSIEFGLLIFYYSKV